MSSCEKIALKFRERLLLIFEDVESHEDENERIAGSFILSHD